MNSRNPTSVTNRFMWFPEALKKKKKKKRHPPANNGPQGGSTLYIWLPGLLVWRACSSPQEGKRRKGRAEGGMEGNEYFLRVFSVPDPGVHILKHINSFIIPTAYWGRYPVLKLFISILNIEGLLHAYHSSIYSLPYLTSSIPNKMATLINPL